MSSASDIFIQTSPIDPRARPLVDGLTREYDSRYGEFYDCNGEPREMEKYPPELFAPPHGNFILLLRDGRAVAGGAFKRFDAHTAEVKRVWTHGDLRGRGLAGRIMGELEAQALRQGYTRLYLTTGFRQPEAVRLYLGRGYTPLFDLSVDPEVHRKLPFEKPLVGAAGPMRPPLAGAHPRLWQPAPYRTGAEQEH